ncbi:MAG TPA: S-methyl-5-thioribose-1-phosphate isomerase [Bacteroidota bacterium]|nr:S-methyl-5-thioribose-1-phosphate isomerase [Bacteroidota bacterium]
MKPLEWQNGKLRFLDQTRLPHEEVYVEADDPQDVADAIKRLSIRGAPLIGIAAAYGVALASRMSTVQSTKVLPALQKAMNLFSSSRPTAVNLFWALERQRRIIENVGDGSPDALFKSLLQEASKIHDEDREMCTKIGAWGADLLPNAAVVLTHCNTGNLATGGTGTAQSVISRSWEQRKLKHVYIDETRPLFQGARLTAWELQKLGIPSTLITDDTAAFLMQRGLINVVITGADRITLTGDVANKVGTYNLAVLAHYHSIPMYIAAPTSSIDFEMEEGSGIPIEQRSAMEVVEINGKRIAPLGIEVYSPAFDITPHHLVSAIITEQGVLRPPYRAALHALHRDTFILKPETA